MEIIEGKIIRAQKVVIYGAEGIGKSTLAAQFPNPLFIDTENGTAHMEVRRIKQPTTWESLLETIEDVAKQPQDVCKTLVLDTADWAETQCISYICGQHKVDGIEDFGYGKGYTYIGEEIKKLLSACDQVITSGKHMVITAHAKMRKMELPDEQSAFDRWELKLSKYAAPLLKEWADLLLFCNYKTFVVTTENKTAKGAGGKRVMYTTHHPCWDAKNRAGLPDELPLDFAPIAHLFQIEEEEKEDPYSKLLDVLKESGVNAKEVQAVVAERTKGKYAADLSLSKYPEEFVSGWVLKYWDNIVEIINKDKAES